MIAFLSSGRGAQFRKCGFVLAALALCAANVTPAAVQLPPGPDKAARATAHVVKSIFEYTRWPTTPDPIRLCLIGRVNYAAGLNTIVLSDGRRVVIREVDPEAFALASACDALYLGDIGMDQLERWNAKVRGSAVVTIAEADPTCRSEAMLCLVYEPRGLSFQLSVDAVARSSVRIDPRVLRMSRQ
jgi:hypothetical protein